MTIHSGFGDSKAVLIDVPVRGQMTDVGPELSGRRLPAGYLASFLEDPTIKPTTPGKPRMPNLALREKEITPLVAFLTAERRAAAR